MIIITIIMIIKVIIITTMIIKITTKIETVNYTILLINNCDVNYNILELSRVLVQVRFAINKPNLKSSITNLVSKFCQELPDEVRLKI